MVKEFISLEVEGKFLLGKYAQPTGPVIPRPVIARAISSKQSSRLLTILFLKKNVNEILRAHKMVIFALRMTPTKSVLSSRIYFGTYLKTSITPRG